MMKEVPTHIAPPHDMSKVACPKCIAADFGNPCFAQDSYTALNKPKSVDHWLQNAKAINALPTAILPSPPTFTILNCDMSAPQDVGDIVVLLDPDCAMIQPMNM
jgi:hypothetical protein